jgi:hypothetical protein
MSEYYSTKIGGREYFFQSIEHYNEAKRNSQGMGASDTFYMQCAMFVYDYNTNSFIKARYSMLDLLHKISVDPQKPRTPLMSELMGPPC